MLPSTALLVRLPASLAGVDFARAAVELDALFRKHGARSQPFPPSLAYKSAALPTSAIATLVLESDRIARAVVTHVRAAPFFAGLSVVVHPRPELEAPLLLADINVPPPGFARAYLDTCGPAVASPSFGPRFRDVLAPILDSTRGPKHTPVPAWIAPVSGGCGGRLRALPGRGETVVRALMRYVERYLIALDEAPPAADAARNAADAHKVREVVRANGPARKHLERTFGAPFASRWLALAWREDAA